VLIDVADTRRKNRAPLGCQSENLTPEKKAPHSRGLLIRATSDCYAACAVSACLLTSDSAS
jgi:hypothetical protein